MSVVSDRFQVCDPQLRELVRAYSDCASAVRRAASEAMRRGHYMEVFDVMAHAGKRRCWQVCADGLVVRE